MLILEGLHPLGGLMTDPTTLWYWIVGAMGVLAVLGGVLRLALVGRYRP